MDAQAQGREAAQRINAAIKEFARTRPLNRMPDDPARPIFEEPLVNYADGDDPLFEMYKTIIAPTHLTPREALALTTDKKAEELPRLSVISWILPIARKTRESNRAESLLPSRAWANTRWYGEKFNEALREHVLTLLREQGQIGTAPAIEPFFGQSHNEKGPYSNWSERHVAYVAGLGTFSLSDGFITEKGIAHRCGSVVTDLQLPPSPRAARTPYSNCLYYADGSCVACIKRCPAGAISEAGHDKNKCSEYSHNATAGLREELKIGVAGCGLCQVKVPCEAKAPRIKR